MLPSHFEVVPQKFHNITRDQRRRVLISIQVSGRQKKGKVPTLFQRRRVPIELFERPSRILCTRGPCVVEAKVDELVVVEDAGYEAADAGGADAVLPLKTNMNNEQRQTDTHLRGTASTG